MLPTWNVINSIILFSSLEPSTCSITVTLEGIVRLTNPHCSKAVIPILITEFAIEILPSEMSPGKYSILND